MTAGLPPIVSRKGLLELWTEKLPPPSAGDRIDYPSGLDALAAEAAETIRKAGEDPADIDRLARRPRREGELDDVFVAARILRTVRWMKDLERRVRKDLATMEGQLALADLMVLAATLAEWKLTAAIVGAEDEIMSGLQLHDTLATARTRSAIVRKGARQPEWKAWQAEAADVRSRNPGLSARRIAQLVAKKFGVSPRTVERRIKSRIAAAVRVRDAASSKDRCS